MQNTHLLWEGMEEDGKEWEGLRGWVCWSGASRVKMWQKKRGGANCVVRMNERVYDKMRICAQEFALSNARWGYKESVQGSKGRILLRKINCVGDKQTYGGGFVVVGNMNARMGNN